MKTVPLRGSRGAGRVALVDDEDYDLVMQYRWYVHIGRNDVLYAFHHWVEHGRTRSQFMHTLLTGFQRTDHRNHDGLDNQRHNLRDGTGGRNAWNTRKIAPASSRFKGVVWDAARQKWIARITADGRTVNLGRWTSEERAARIWDAAARMLHGEYAVLNFPDLESSSSDDLPPEASKANRDKTHCKRGHEFTLENTQFFIHKSGSPGRACKTCKRDHLRESRRSKGAKPRGSGGGYVADRKGREAA